jgi:hypothetical protein
MMDFRITCRTGLKRLGHGIFPGFFPGFVCSHQEKENNNNQVVGHDAEI